MKNFLQLSFVLALSALVAFSCKKNPGEENQDPNTQIVEKEDDKKGEQASKDEPNTPDNPDNPGDTPQNPSDSIPENPKTEEEQQPVVTEKKLESIKFSQTSINLPRTHAASAAIKVEFFPADAENIPSLTAENFTISKSDLIVNFSDDYLTITPVINLIEQNSQNYNGSISLSVNVDGKRFSASCNIIVPSQKYDKPTVILNGSMKSLNLIDNTEELLNDHYQVDATPLSTNEYEISLPAIDNLPACKVKVKIIDNNNPKMNIGFTEIEGKEIKLTNVLINQITLGNHNASFEVSILEKGMNQGTYKFDGKGVLNNATTALPNVVKGSLQDLMGNVVSSNFSLSYITEKTTGKTTINLPPFEDIPLCAIQLKEQGGSQYQGELEINGDIIMIYTKNKVFDDLEITIKKNGDANDSRLFNFKSK